jgi:hypothetical protein
MGVKTRAVGADVEILGITETTYGTAPTSGYKKLFAKSFTVDQEKPLGSDPLLGTGRDELDPYYEPSAASGDVEIPQDVQALGFWLHGLFGAPVTTQIPATGTIVFSAQPAVDSTITVNGVTWTFKTSGAAGPQTDIGGDLEATLTALAANLNASADTDIDDATYTSDATTLTVTHDTAGTAGNAFTLAALAASNGTASAATLLGGGYSHAFTSGAAVPSKALQLGHLQLTTAKYYRPLGFKCGTLAFELSRSGPANATITGIAQTVAEASATIDGSATAYALTRFSQSQGRITVGGAQLGNVTGGALTYDNTLEAIETIRPDGLIDGVDEGVAMATGSVTVRFGTDATLPDLAANETPAAMVFSLSHPGTGYSVTYSMPRTFFPQVKRAVTGPAGIEQTYEWKAAKDSSAGYLMRVTLVNDVASYA